jgi:catechol 2,3-dioxygenase
MDTNNPIDRQVRIGHVHLKVADLERALQFYCGVLGFEITQRYGRRRRSCRRAAIIITSG